AVAQRRGIGQPPGRARNLRRLRRRHDPPEGPPARRRRLPHGTAPLLLPRTERGRLVADDPRARVRSREGLRGQEVNGERVLKLGLPKGSLEQATIELFRKAGWKISGSDRIYFPSIDDPEIRGALMRPQEMPRYIADGTLDAGVTGKDWIVENGVELTIVADFVYSKVSRRPTRWVLAVPADSSIHRLEDLK